MRDGDVLSSARSQTFAHATLRGRFVTLAATKSGCTSPLRHCRRSSHETLSSHHQVLKGSPRSSSSYQLRQTIVASNPYNGGGGGIVSPFTFLICIYASHSSFYSQRECPNDIFQAYVALDMFIPNIDDIVQKLMKEGKGYINYLATRVSAQFSHCIKIS
jgi:hypothetical protein